MNAIDHIKAAKAANLVDEDGEPIALRLLPSVNESQIRELESRVGQNLPAELRTLLGYCAGLDGCLEGIDFTGETMSFEQKEVFPCGLPIAADGFGNFWVLDITPDTVDIAPVYYACHDAPVILFQSQDLASFLSEVFRMNTPPHKSLIDDVHEDRIFDVWIKNPHVIDQPAALLSADAKVRTFAQSLNERFQIVDLRNAAPGMGFSWGRYGPKSEIRRYEFERIFAYAKPLKTGLFAKMFSRG